MNYWITRHQGALHWMQQHLQSPGVHLKHLDQFRHIGPGDLVIGTLPINRIAALCTQGARYLHLEIDLPAHLRGRELTREQMTELNVDTVEYSASRILAGDTAIALPVERKQSR